VIVKEDRLSGIDSVTGRVPAAALVVAAALLLIGLVGATPADAKGKKLHACVAKKGPDKGAMTFSRSGKCHKGEKTVSWKKKGKAGPTGPTGPSGPQGPSGLTGELLATITQQTTTIETLTTQVDTLITQVDALTTQLDTVNARVNGLAPQVAALCGKMSAVTSRANVLRGAINGLDLNAVLTTLGGALIVPALPAPLSAFSCP
jgi:hypothetical protein